MAVHNVSKRSYSPLQPGSHGPNHKPKANMGSSSQPKSAGKRPAFNGSVKSPMNKKGI